MLASKANLQHRHWGLQGDFSAKEVEASLTHEIIDSLHVFLGHVAMSTGILGERYLSKQFMPVDTAELATSLNSMDVR